jgi:AcrR family transcriptional regulator
MEKTDKRERILEAAEKLFKQRRFHEITLQEIAQAAKVGKGTIYLYFEDKDDLFFQMVTSGFDDLCEVVERHCALATPFVDRLHAMCEEVSAFFERRTQMFNIIQGEAAWMPGGAKGKLMQRWVKRRKKLIDATVNILSQGVEEGVVRADMPIEVMAMYLLGMLRTRTRDLVDFPKDHRSHHVLVELFCNGTLECAVEKKRPRNQKRELACAR